MLDLPELDLFPPNFYLHPYSLEGYLGSTATVLADKRFSVRDVVNYVANQFGGVHLAPHLDDYDHQLLARFNAHKSCGSAAFLLPKSLLRHKAIELLTWFSTNCRQIEHSSTIGGDTTLAALQQ